MSAAQPLVPTPSSRIIDRELTWAVRAGREEEVQNLLARGALSIVEGTTCALAMAIVNAHSGAAGMRIFRSVLAEATAQQGDLQTPNPDGQTLLMLGAQSASAQVASELIGAGAQVSACDAQGLSPLHVITFSTDPCEDRQLAMLDVLLKAGASLSAVDDEGRTPLHIAALGSFGLLIDHLIRAGADPHALDAQGDNAAHHAARWEGAHRNCAHTIQRLAAHGVSLEIENGQGNRPLHVAVMAGNVLGVVALLDAGVDSQAINKSSMTAWQLAQSMDKNEVCAVFESKAALAAIEQLLQTTPQCPALRFSVSG